MSCTEFSKFGQSWGCDWRISVWRQSSCINLHGHGPIAVEVMKALLHGSCTLTPPPCLLSA